MKHAAALALLLLVANVRDSDACAPAPPRGEEVRIAEEEALIIWDPATKTETFIRRAAFQSTTRKFGFLVPTPTLPALSEAEDSMFGSLADLTRAPIEYDRSETDYEPISFFHACTGGLAKSKGEEAPAAVRVLQTASVAGFNATTVEADDATALTKWLGDNGFEVTPQLTKWLERYVTDKWKVTAFVVGTDSGQSTSYDIATKAVKMTFPTERPFYPYREPQIEMSVETNAKLAPPAFARMLRLYFLSNERYAATLAGQPWSAKLLQAGKQASLGLSDVTVVPDYTYLTVFVDESSPRRGIEELYFAPSADKADVKQPPRIIKVPHEVEIPVDLIIIGALIVFFVVRAGRRARRATK